MLGWVVPITITGKLIFSDVCNKNLTWDEPVLPDVEKRWKVWMYMLEQSKNTEVPRSVQTHAGSYFKLHGFSDVSNLGLCEAIYVLEYINTKPFSQHQLAAKSRIKQKEQSIPRLELTAALMLAKLQPNILVSLENYPITSCHYWVGSTTVLYWLLTKSLWTVYVRNRVNTMEALSNVDPNQ